MNVPVALRLTGAFFFLCALFRNKTYKISALLACDASACKKKKNVCQCEENTADRKRRACINVT